MQANSILKCGGAISIGIYRGVYGQEYIQEFRVENESLDEINQAILNILPESEINTEEAEGFICLK